jgi:uncharacterized protein YgiM (DUF1202 family)
MYGVGQPAPRRRSLIVIIGVVVLALILVLLFFAFYQLVLKDDNTASTPSPEATVTEQIAVSPTEDSAPSSTNTATSKPVQETPTIPPTVAPTVTSAPTPTLRPPAEVITIGVRARVNISEGLAINLRDQPTLSGSTVLTQLVGGSEVDVFDGPEEADDLVWWNVNDGGENAGWVVEGFGGETWLVPIGWTDELPPLEGSTPTTTPSAVTPEATPTFTATATTTPTITLTATPEITPTATPVLTPTVTSESGIRSPTVGGQARVTTKYQFVNMRSAPGLNSDVIGQLADGITVTILEGPEEADNLRWWRVDDGEENVGWAAERLGQEVFLVPIP